MEKAEIQATVLVQDQGRTLVHLHLSVDRNSNRGGGLEDVTLAVQSI